MKGNNSDILVSSIGRDPQKALILLQTISQIVQISNRQAPFNIKFDQILTFILNYLGVERGSIMVLERNKLHIVAASRQDLVGMKKPVNEESISGWVATHKTPIFIPDISKDNRFSGRPGTAYKKNSLLSAPILQEKKVIGVINANDKSGDKDLLQEDITYLLDFGSLIISSLVQQRMQNELKQQRSTLRKRNKELKRQEQIRDELSSLLIHDLKSPLSEVIANLDILSYSLSGPGLELLEAAQVSCNRTVRMVGNLLTINKIEDGKMALFREETNIENLLDEAYSGIKGLAQIKNVRLSLDLPCENLPSARIDRVLILRVLQNLLTNALEHSTSQNEIVLGCSPAAKKNTLEFYVQDQGSGIFFAQHKDIFDKYFRVSGAQGNDRGTGLGLYFCKLAVELHKGSIGMVNQAVSGCRFFFTIPI